MGGLKEADDFKSKRRAAQQRINATHETYQNVLKFPAGIERMVFNPLSQGVRVSIRD
jgi:hypothetical protein